MSEFSEGHTLRDDVTRSDGPHATGFVGPARVSAWRRLWFVVSCVPRYLATGKIDVP